MVTGTNGLSNKPNGTQSRRLMDRPHAAAMAAFGLLSLALPGTAHAAKTTFVPVISVSETYTDNVNLDVPGAEQYDWVTAATAGFNFAGTGARARLNLSYSPTLYSFARQNQTDLRHNLSSAGEIELVEDHFYLTESARVYQSFAGSHRDISISDSNLSGDRRQVYNFSVSPELRNRFGGFAVARLNYTFLGLYADTPADPLAASLTDTVTHSINASIASGENFQRFQWSLNGTWREEDRIGGVGNVSNHHVTVSSQYSINRFFAVTGTFGYQDYGYSVNSNFNGVNWDAGVRITPSRRMILTVSYGRQTGHDRLTFTGSYRPGDNTNVSLSYNETFETSQGLLSNELPTFNSSPSPGLGLGLGSSFNSFGATDVPGTTFTDLVFLQKRFSFAAQHVIGRTSFSFNAYREIRTVNGAEIERAISGSGSINRTFSQVLTGQVTGRYIRRDDPTGRMDDVYLASASLNRRLVGRASAFVSYQFTKRTSNVFAAELMENAVTVGLSSSF